MKKLIWRALITCISSLLFLVLIDVQWPQAIFWALYLAISIFSVSYGTKVKKEKAIKFYRYSFYLFAILTIVGVFAIRLNWSLSWSILVGGLLAVIGSLITYFVLTADEIEDELA